MALALSLAPAYAGQQSSQMPQDQGNYPSQQQQPSQQPGQPGQGGMNAPMQSAQTDAQVQQQVQSAINSDQQLQAAGVSAAVSNGKVTLSGNVADATLKQHAENLASSVAGVTQVEDDINVAPAGATPAAGAAGQTTPEQTPSAGQGQQAQPGAQGDLNSRINQALLNDPELSKYAITASVNDKGKVTLDGTVPNKNLKSHAKDTVKNIPGVKKVQNQIAVNPSVPPMEGQRPGAQPSGQAPAQQPQAQPPATTTPEQPPGQQPPAQQQPGMEQQPGQQPQAQPPATTTPEQQPGQQPPAQQQPGMEQQPGQQPPAQPPATTTPEQQPGQQQPAQQQPGMEQQPGQQPQAQPPATTTPEQQPGQQPPSTTPPDQQQPPSSQQPGQQSQPPATSQLSGSALQDKITNTLKADPALSAVTATVADNTVTLNGSVASDADKATAERTVLEVSPASTIQDQISVSPAPGATGQQAMPPQR